MASTKLSILAFYKHVFMKPSFIYQANFMALVVLAWLIAFFFTTLFQAWPIYQNWTGVGRKLLDELSMYLALGISDVLTDFIILCLPIPVIHSLHVTTTKKIMVGAILGLGFLYVTASLG